jgi:hypothetical protein
VEWQPGLGHTMVSGQVCQKLEIFLHSEQPEVVIINATVITVS